VNAGDPAFVPSASQRDIDGRPRVVYGRVDIGASEFSWTGDFDFDADVDLGDFGPFQSCFNGPQRPPRESCTVAADFDNDADVDLVDFVVFSTCFNGPNRPPQCQP
jgi:hypothetical protein